MKKFICSFILFIFLSGSMFAQSGWYQLSTGLNVYWYTVYFTSVNTGYVAGNQFIIKTTDGGNTWAVSLYASSERYRHLIFVNQSTGIVIGRDGLIMKTTNSGLNWVQKYSGTVNDLLQLYMVNENTGYICGGFGEYLKTTNGGNNWSGYTISNSHMYSVFFTSAPTGWIAGENGMLFKTTNSGNNWIIQALPYLFNMYEIFFLNPFSGWIVGSEGKLLYSTNGGNNWYLRNTGSISTYHHVLMRNSGKGWMVGDSSILKTTDLGIHWTSQPLPFINETFVQSFFISDTLGYVVGYNGALLKTTNGGNPTGVTPITKNVPETYRLYQNYPNPFNPTTTINYELPKAGYVKLVVYDILGREIAVLVNEKQSAGKYKVQWDASDFPSGVYFCKLITEKYSATRKLILLK